MIVRPCGLWEWDDVIVWRLHHLNTLLWTFCEGVSVLEFNIFVLFDANLLLFRVSRYIKIWQLNHVFLRKASYWWHIVSWALREQNCDYSQGECPVFDRLVLKTDKIDSVDTWPFIAWWRNDPEWCTDYFCVTHDTWPFIEWCMH